MTAQRTTASWHQRRHGTRLLLPLCVFAALALIAVPCFADWIQILENTSLETAGGDGGKDPQYFERSSADMGERKTENARQGIYAMEAKLDNAGRYMRGIGNNSFRVSWDGRYENNSPDATGGVRPGFVMAGEGWARSKDSGKDNIRWIYWWYNLDGPGSWMSGTNEHNSTSYQAVRASNTNPVPTAYVNDRYRPRFERDTGNTGNATVGHMDTLAITAAVPTLALGPAPGTVSFPATEMGTTNEITIVVTNNGETGTVLYGAYITNSSDLTSTTWSKTAWYENSDPSNVFSFASGTNVELQVGESQAVTIRFSPTTGGQVHTGTVRIATTDPINRYGSVDAIQTTIQYEEYTLIGTSLWSAAQPVIDNDGGALSSAADEATLRGTFSDGGIADIYIYWGKENRTNDAANWENVLTNGLSVSQGTTFSNTVSNLYYGIRYYYNCYATNSAGTNWASPTTNFVTPNPGGLAITNTYATNIVIGDADLLGELDATQSVFEVTAYWSTNNNADGAAWLADSGASNSYMGWYTNVTDQFLSNHVSSLIVGATYYYTYFCTNAATSIWASPNATFQTVADPPSVTNGAPVVGTPTNATLTGILGDNGYASTTVYTYWGLSDGDTNKTDWDFVITNTAVSEGGFSNTVGGLWYGLRYYYRCYATNSAGDDWADWTTNFTTVSPAAGWGLAPTYATNVGGSYADGLGEVDFTQSVFHTFVYWSTNNNAGPAAWLADGSASSASLGWFTNVMDHGVTGNLTGLDFGSTNYYTFMATNLLTSIWASANASFVTLLGDPPILTSGWGTTNIATNSAVFHGYLSSTGTSETTVWLLYGTVENGESLGGWQYTNQIGVASDTGLITTNIAGLLPGTNYYYRFYASNTGGSNWSPAVQFSTAPWTVPFYDPFEERYLGELNGQNGWQVSTNGAAVVQTSVVYAGTNAVEITNADPMNGATLSHTFVTNTYTNHVWVDFRSRVVFAYGPGEIATNDTAVFYVNTSSNIVAYDGPDPVLLNNTAVPGGTNWSRFTTDLNYTNRTWDLYLDANLVATNLSFYNTNRSSFVYLYAVEHSTDSASYYDNISITLTNPLPPGEIPVVDNANGATLIDGAVGTAYLNGNLSGFTADVRVYYGTTDGVTTPGSWDTSVILSNTAVGNFSNQVSSLSADQTYYYRCYATNEYGDAWAPNSSVWMAQTRRESAWHLVSVPVDYGPGQNTLNGALGTNLAGGLAGGQDDFDADLLWHQSGTNWTGYWLNTNDVWQDASTNPATLTLGPGTAYWIKRQTNGGVATAYSTFAGDKPTTSTQLVFALSNWTTFGWPYDQTTQDGDSWGFAITGATKALGSEYADRIRAEYGGVWYNLYLYTNGNWCIAGTRNKANIMLQPGKGYYYYRRGSTDLIWSAPGP